MLYFSTKVLLTWAVSFSPGKCFDREVVAQGSVFLISRQITAGSIVETERERERGYLLDHEFMMMCTFEWCLVLNTMKKLKTYTMCVYF